MKTAKMTVHPGEVVRAEKLLNGMGYEHCGMPDERGLHVFRLCVPNEEWKGTVLRLKRELKSFELRGVSMERENSADGERENVTAFRAYSEGSGSERPAARLFGFKTMNR